MLEQFILWGITLMVFGFVGSAVIAGIIKAIKDNKED